MPLEIKLTLQVALLSSFQRYWKYRNDKYWRTTLREYVVAMRYLRNK
jgi:hypothetical protein